MFASATGPMAVFCRTLWLQSAVDLWPFVYKMSKLHQFILLAMCVKLCHNHCINFLRSQWRNGLVCVCVCVCVWKSSYSWLYMISYSTDASYWNSPERVTEIDYYLELEQVVIAVSVSCFKCSRTLTVSLWSILEAEGERESGVLLKELCSEGVPPQTVTFL